MLKAIEKFVASSRNQNSLPVIKKNEFKISQASTFLYSFFILKNKMKLFKTI